MKAIITDLDRTLLRPDKSVSAYTAAVLNQCRERGIRLMAASARPLRDIRLYQAQLGFDAVVASNGAVIALPEQIIEYKLGWETGEKMLAGLMRFPDVFLSVETSRGLYSNRDIPQWQPVVYRAFPRLPEGAGLYKILASSKEKRLYDEIAQIVTPDAYFTLANGDLIQIMSREATKWRGILHMLAHFDLDARDAVYFGDDYDDIEALQKCGRGVAVANAIPDALQAADAIAESYEADGVARYIHAHFLS